MRTPHRPARSLVAVTGLTSLPNAQTGCGARWIEPYFPSVKRPGCDGDQPSEPNGEVNVLRYTDNIPILLHGLHTEHFTLPSIFFVCKGED
jgi:hypothetical protein